MAKLKLVGAKRYGNPKLGKETILRGQVVTVDDPAVVEILKQDIRRDTLNNTFPVWEVIEEDETVESNAETADDDNTGGEGGDDNSDVGDEGGDDSTGEDISGDEDGAEESEEGSEEEGNDEGEKTADEDTGEDKQEKKEGGKAQTRSRPGARAKGGK